MIRLRSLGQWDRASIGMTENAISIATICGIQWPGQRQNIGNILREDEFKPSNTEEVMTDLMMSWLWFLEFFCVYNFVVILSLRG